MLPLRSVLYLPASNRRAIDKVKTLPADAVIFDLEDAVAPDAKIEGRRNLEQAFAEGGVASSMAVIRVNALGSDELEADLEMVRKCSPQALLLPKVSRPEDVIAIRRSLEGNHPMSLWCMVETAQGLLRAAEIAGVSEHELFPLSCFVIGTNDIARETGASMEEGRQFMVPWLMSAVLAAKANGLAILDGVWNNFRDVHGFEREAMQGLRMGFDGKTLIHPTQVEPANRIFAPAPEAVEQARAIVTAFADPANAGKGVINIGGRMVELLHLEMARQLLSKHEAIQRRSVLDR
ncbi:HpcH/HpaI aldolase/citrate lyase family protein [Hyphomicrobium sp.]|uniref:HpcH/HpaI aldolase/citrate lyase family protein n=1 Tax=Hyphomicrobium sp. TaxID=82 RepID=UPI002FE05F2B